MNEIRIGRTLRGSLADVLRGLRSLDTGTLEVGQRRLKRKLHTNEVGVGYVDGHFGAVPDFIVIPSANRREFFAWVNTYCPFVTPLSQWCRVFTEEEFARIQTMGILPAYGRAASAWAGAAIGEAILHIGTGTKLSQISISAIQSCTSFVAARAFGLWRSSEVRIAAVERYERARRILGVDSLLPATLQYDALWSVLDSLAADHGGGTTDDSDHIRLAVQCCTDIRSSGFVSEAVMSRVLHELGWPAEFARFEGSGAEQRVALFDVGVEKLLGRDSSAPQEQRLLMEFTVAYFAARIGGGASEHVMLLDRWVRDYPMIAVWYGVVSSLHRAEAWGAEFGGLARLALKELAFPLRFDDPPRCDVAFEELEALVDPGTRTETLRFRGGMRRALSVEVALGVTGTISLTGTAEQESPVASSRVDELAIREVVRHLEAATDSARKLVQVTGATRQARSAGRTGESGRRRGRSERGGNPGRQGGGQLEL